MYEGFSTHARYALAVAQALRRDQSREMGETLDLLGGVITNKKIGRLLSAAGLDVSAIPHSNTPSRVSVQKPNQDRWSAKAKEVLEMSLRESLSMKSSRIEVEHLTLAIVNRNSGLPDDLQKEVVAARSRVRSSIFHSLGYDPAMPPDWPMRL